MPIQNALGLRDFVTLEPGGSTEQRLGFLICSDFYEKKLPPGVYSLAVSYELDPKRVGMREDCAEAHSGRTGPRDRYEYEFDEPGTADLMSHALSGKRTSNAVAIRVVE